MRTKIGEGRTSVVYREDDRAFKEYPLDHSLDAINEELRINHLISTHTQLPVSPLIATNQPYVLSMKYLGSETMTSKMLNREKNIVEDLVDLQLSVFKFRDLPLDNIHIRYQRRISSSRRLTQEQKEISLDILASLTFEPILVHMDFHPSNLIYCDGQYWIIDWVNAGLANPLLCIGRTFILLHYHAYRRSQKYLTLISKKTGWSKEIIRKIAIIQAADRIMETEDPFEVSFMSEYIEKESNSENNRKV
ncbi:MAG: hypothetical protein CVU96_07235 [Firmicutes bacterium HGW-Firmicutes-20]|jgi:thiamine kinase-like enzyme|nr:MAG: hypothetical protein CVU96_07235 [Firmicutes bacterium HGW-Firmicutes-20]PKM88436.1 MAG: hypothetical protein CVU85_04125 [Firmicutes bacterium HGW-Firmicutes-10]